MGKFAVFRLTSRIVIAGVIVLILASLMGCNSGQLTGGKVEINDIIWNISEFQGETVTVQGEYRGWEMGYGTPPIGINDWILKDETGGIYVSGPNLMKLSPVNDKGTMLTVRGTVRVKNGQAYIKAESIKYD